KVYLAEDLADQFSFGIKGHPESIRNFLRYARAKFPTAPKNVLLIGKAVNYIHVRSNATNPDMDKLNFVPTFGWPASDVLLTAEPGDGQPLTPIGRLSVVNAEEIHGYLRKIKEYELAQQTASPYIRDKEWMKNVVHIVGATEPGLQLILDNYMDDYKKIIQDTLFGAKVTTFTKSSAEAIEMLNSGAMDRLFEEGISLITYFGHSSATTLDFNLNNPEQYNNQGKYPMFIGLGCNAGNFYNFNSQRITTKETLSEKYVLAPNRGTIGFIASSHFGIVHYLDIASSRQYKSITYEDYGKSMGEIMLKTIRSTFDFTTQDDFYARSQAEETSLHGDPAITLNSHAKPDYVIEPQMMKLAPNFISVADASFRLKAIFLNQGKAISKEMVVEVKQQFPDGSTRVIHRVSVPGTRYIDSLILDIPIVASRDKGNNKITVTLDADNISEELFETNNTVTKEVIIYEDEARPVFPYDFAIVNEQNIKLKASTANPFSQQQQYRMEIDTSELFAAPLNVQTVSAPGGVIEFTPGVTFMDSTVYYWRISPVPSNGVYKWNSSSFIYISGSSEGFNQSHYFQDLKTASSGMKLDGATRTWIYDSMQNNLNIKNGVFPTASGQEADYSVAINGVRSIRSACIGFSLIFNVFNPQTFKPRENLNSFMGSAAVCATSRKWNFEYSFMDRTGRKKAMDFMDWIPDGSYVVVRNITGNGQASAFANEWQGDTAAFGSGNSIYHRLKAAGLTNIDNYSSPKAFTLVYQKNRNGFTPVKAMTNGIFDLTTLSVDIKSPDSLGYMISPQFGPAKAWKELRWSGTSIEPMSTDNPTLNLIGIRPNGSKDTLIQRIRPQQNVVDVSGINAAQYPYLQLHLRNMDSVNFSPYQVKYWQLNYSPAPEGAVVPTLSFSAPDTLDIGEPGRFKLAFKNISTVPFDSVRVKVTLLDQNNVQHVLIDEKRRPLPVNDTLSVDYQYINKQYPGANSISMVFNPDNDQPEQYHFNNFIFRNLFVKGDTLNPLLDVTFDNTHILNGDIVSAKPNIVIKLKDEAKWMLLDTASLVSVQVRYPDANGQLSQNSVTRTFTTGNDTLRFIPAQQIPNSNNTATLDFNPQFAQDGDYELIVTGKDRSNNKAGALEYRVGFQVISKAMISNMLNYPNPFTTSTAFVFTITGTEVPQNLKIQILTVTGKIVREITKEELGPLRVGRNITEFKWNGTDQYGQKLANGVYIYRVVTNLNGKSLEKYKAKNDDTDKYFNKGYGKMYLMR
ncbi:MAG TPA: C25 family cysteine peptidase, partial [Flavisolibacter sp.]